MLRRVLPLIAFYGGPVGAWTSTSWSFSTEFSCSTEYDSGGTQPTPLPRSTTTSAVTVSSLLPAKTIEAVIRITASTVTTTDYTSLSVVATQETVTSATLTSYSVIHSVIATAVIPKTVCTNGVVPLTVTEYAGTYQAVTGQPTDLPSKYPVSIGCTKRVTTFWGIIPIEYSTVTSTVTATSRAFVPTTTSTTYINLGGAATVYATSVTIVTTSYTVTYSEAVTSMACAATTTTTYAAKCAPTNLISSINGIGLVTGTYAANTTVTYGPHDRTPYQYDLSMCCQMCVNNPGCGAIMGGIGGACGLLYVGGPKSEPQCPKIFTYKTQSNVAPGGGLVVQSGCAEIEYAA
ncbi:hypothetical protein GQ53DRAFT_831897 [Thozetella sp. PMI_491]|nr:hypothetical protein GQ53DRAFT_831897 [Thozetella sp. PMI_491]